MCRQCTFNYQLCRVFLILYPLGCLFPFHIFDLRHFILILCTAVKFVCTECLISLFSISRIHLGENAQTFLPVQGEQHRDALAVNLGLDSSCHGAWDISTACLTSWTLVPCGDTKFHHQLLSGQITVYW